jgi:AraC-like DNA-binding protein
LIVSPAEGDLHMRNGHLAGGLASIPSASGEIARLACDRLRDKGADLTPVLADAGLTIDDIQDRTRRIDANVQVKVLELAARQLHDDWLGFHLARDFELGRIGLVYYVIASSERLADALRNGERYCAINNEAVRLRVSTERSFAIALDYSNIDRISDRHQLEFWLVALLRVCRTVTSTRLAPKQIKVRHFRPETPPEVRSFLGCAIDFDADGDEILFPRSVGDLPLVRADFYLNKLLLDYADKALQDRNLRSASIRSRVESEIVQLLPHGSADAAQVARRLGMNRETLARALSAEGTNFSGLLQTLRQALAERYLREKDIPICEVAWLSGFDEISAFNDAFVRWTGLTPQAFRDANDLH